MKSFYVYAHFKATTGELFYIGKGSGRRAWTRTSRNRHWKSIVSKHGRKVRIIKDGLAEHEAFALEAKLIASRQGKLATYTNGGSGISGYRHTENAKASMSEKRRGKPKPEAAKAAMSETIRSRPDLLALRAALFQGSANPSHKLENRIAASVRMTVQNPMTDLLTKEKMRASRIGHVNSPECRQKISAALKGRKRGPVLPHVREALAKARHKRKRAVETACGLRFESTLAAAEATGARQGNIVNNCVGRAKSAGGYIWRYADELPQ